VGLRMHRQCRPNMLTPGSTGARSHVTRSIMPPLHDTSAAVWVDSDEETFSRSNPGQEQRHLCPLMASLGATRSAGGESIRRHHLDPLSSRDTKHNNPLAPPRRPPSALPSRSRNSPTYAMACLSLAAVIVLMVAASTLATPAMAGFDLRVRISDVHLGFIDTADPAAAAEAKILVEEGCLAPGGPPLRKLLKFSTTIRNDGDKDLKIGLPPHNRTLRTARWEVRFVHGTMSSGRLDVCSL